MVEALTTDMQTSILTRINKFGKNLKRDSPTWRQPATDCVAKQQYKTALGVAEGDKNIAMHGGTTSIGECVALLRVVRVLSRPLAITGLSGKRRRSSAH